jgi:hypothetical protein
MMRRSLFLYVAVTLACGMAIALGLHWGSSLEAHTSRLLALNPPPTETGDRAAAILMDHLRHPLGGTTTCSMSRARHIARVT